MKNSLKQIPQKKNSVSKETVCNGPDRQEPRPTVIVIKPESPKPYWGVIKLLLVLMIVVVAVVFPRVIEVIIKLLKAAV